MLRGFGLIGLLSSTRFCVCIMTLFILAEVSSLSTFVLPPRIYLLSFLPVLYVCLVLFLHVYLFFSLFFSPVLINLFCLFVSYNFCFLFLTTFTVRPFYLIPVFKIVLTFNLFFIPFFVSFFYLSIL